MNRLPRHAHVPHVVRVDLMPLDCGGGAAVIELEQAPARGWYKAFKRVLGDTEGLEAVQARCDGRFVYIIGLEPGHRGIQHRIMQALAEAHLRTGSVRLSTGTASVATQVA